MDIAIHCNTSLNWQCDYAEAILSGFVACGEKAFITRCVSAKAAFHVVLGPHYALDQWRWSRDVILIDRCFYRGNPDHVSAGWWNPGIQARTFSAGEGRTPPEIRPKDFHGNKTIFLADYNGPVETADTVRLHPGNKHYEETLEAALSRHDVAIGHSTTALVTAALMDLEIICRDPAHILNQPNWLELLPYADWSIKEISEGLMWQHLRL